MERSSTARRGLFYGLAAGLALMAVIAIAGVATKAGDPASHASRAPGVEPVGTFTPSPDEPCHGAQKADLQSEQTQRDLEDAGFSAYLPDSPAAGASNLTGTWWCPNSPSLRLEFQSGVTLSLENGRILGDIDEHWRRLAEQGDGRILKLDSGTALASPENGEGSHSVQLVMSDRTWVIVFGGGKETVDDLVAIADTLEPTRNQ